MTHDSLCSHAPGASPQGIRMDMVHTLIALFLCRGIGGIAHNALLALLFVYIGA